MVKQRSDPRHHHQHGNVELIEVFAPDDVSPWPDTTAQVAGSSDSPTDRPQSRRGVVLAGFVAIVAVIAVAVALSDDTTSDSTLPTTALATPTTQRSLLDPTAAAHYLIDDPALTPYSADLVTPPSIGEQVRVYTDGTAIGPIVIIEAHPHPYEAYGIVGATRDVVDGTELVRSKAACPTASAPVTTRCETLISEVAIDGAWSVTVRATRLSDAEVVQIVNGLRVIDGTLAEDSDVMERLELGLTFEDESLDDLIFGRVESAVRYLTANGEIATLRSAVGVSEHRLAGVRYSAIDTQMFDYDSVYGRLPDTGEVIVVWENEGRLLSLVAPGDPAEVIRLSRQVRPATDSEWSAMVYGLRPDYRIGDFATLATGHASNTELWRAGPQLAERGGRTEFLWWWTVPGRDDYSDSTPASSAVGTRPHVDTLVVPGATFVFVSHPSAGGTVTVRTAKGVEFVAELMQPFAQSPVYMTVVRVEEPGPVTVDIDGVSVSG